MNTIVFPRKSLRYTQPQQKQLHVRVSPWKFSISSYGCKYWFCLSNSPTWWPNPMSEMTEDWISSRSLGHLLVWLKLQPLINKYSFWAAVLMWRICSSANDPIIDTPYFWGYKNDKTADTSAAWWSLEVLLLEIIPVSIFFPLLQYLVFQISGISFHSFHFSQLHLQAEMSI